MRKISPNLPIAFGILTAGYMAYTISRTPTRSMPYLSDGDLVRSIIVAESTRPTMMKASLWAFNVAKSLHLMPLLTPIIRPTFYRHFCGGENSEEVRSNVSAFSRAGYRVCLGSAKEEGSGAMNGILQSIQLSNRGDYIFIKVSGLENGAESLSTGEIKGLETQLRSICDSAKQRDVRVLVDAEKTPLQPMIDDMVIRISKDYNKQEALIYNTYQMYLINSPNTFNSHLKLAQQHNFQLGAKLVRGAYINSEPRELIFPTIEQTHAAYDAALSIAAKNQHCSTVLATHNHNSVELAKQVDVDHKFVYAFLKGRGDDLAYSLVSNNYNVVKYIPWGSVNDCMLYLERRAVEFSGSDDRELRAALWEELRSRVSQRISFLPNQTATKF